MADIGAITEFINNDEFTLEVGSNNYARLEDLVVKIGNIEYRANTNDSGATYFLGGGDNFMTFTLTLTSPEFSSLNTLTQLDSSGIPTATSWLIKTVDLSGTGKSMAATGYLRDYTTRKGVKGYLEIFCFVRIQGRTVTIS